MEGVVVEKNEHYALCKIDNFSEDLKNAIRKSLSDICHGPETVKTGRFSVTYKETLKEFNRRYKGKNEKHQKGYIAELLTHILLFKIYPTFKVANPFFNLEDKGAKKGFDLIVYDPSLNDIWITEVKSGNAKQSDSANKVNCQIIDRAKNDLKERLSSNNTTLWHNALNGADKILAEGNTKLQITKILDDCYKESSREEQKPSSKNVILTSVIYKKTDDPITSREVEQKRSKIQDERIFQDLIVFSIQKETYSRVAAFIEEEAKS